MGVSFAGAMPVCPAHPIVIIMATGQTKANKPSAKAGRPSKYTKELSERICARIAAGESLVKICKDAKMPSRSSVLLWLSQNSEFSDRYTQAREAQADYLLEELLEIADDGRNDTYKTDDGRELTNQDVIARSRLRVDARKWVIAKLAPKKYAEKITQEVTGKDGKDLIPPSRVLNISKDTTPEQIKAMAKALGVIGNGEYDTEI